MHFEVGHRHPAAEWPFKLGACIDKGPERAKVAFVEDGRRPHRSMECGRGRSLTKPFEVRPGEASSGMFHSLLAIDIPLQLNSFCHSVPGIFRGRRNCREQLRIVHQCKRQGRRAPKSFGVEIRKHPDRASSRPSRNRCGHIQVVQTAASCRRSRRWPPYRHHPQHPRRGLPLDICCCTMTSSASYE